MKPIADEFEMEIGLVTSEESSLLPHLSNPSHDPCHEMLFAEFAVGYDCMLLTRDARGSLFLLQGGTGQGRGKNFRGGAGRQMLGAGRGNS